MSEVTQLLEAIERGEARAADLLPIVYEDLRTLAAQRLSQEEPGQTLDATALVHEAYLRLVGDADERRWQNRGHFFGAAAEAMRRILVESARRKCSIKHGGGRARLDLSPELQAAPERSADLLALDEALSLLAAKDPLKAELVKLRYFAGLTADQAARVLDISPSVGDRHWAYARAWLHRAIGQQSQSIR